MINIQIILAVKHELGIILSGCNAIRPCNTVEELFYDLKLHRDSKIMQLYLTSAENSQYSLFNDNLAYSDPNPANSVVVDTEEKLASIMRKGYVVSFLLDGEEWKISSTVDNYRTNGFIPLNDFLKLAYSVEYPLDIMESVLEHERYPVVVESVEEYSDHSVAKLRTLFVDHPAELEYEDNFVF